MTKKGFSWWESLHFQFNLLFSIVLLALIGGLIFVYIYLPRQFEQRVKIESLTLSRQVATRIEQYLRVRAEAIEGAASLSAFRSGQIDDQTEALREIYPLLSPLFSRLYIINSDGTVIAHEPTNPSIVGRNYSNTSYFQETIRSGRVYYSDVFVIGKGEPTIVVSAPLRGEGGEIIGTINGGISLPQSAITEFVTNLKIGYGGLAFLVDRRGTLIAHPDQARVLRQENVGNFEPVKKVIRAKEGMVISRLDGKDQISSFTPIKTVGWGVIISRPYSEVFSLLNKVKLIIWLLFALALGIVIFSFLYGRRVVLLPLADLREGIKTIIGGKFDYQIKVRARGEIAELTEAFNTMAGVLSRCYKVTQVLNSMSSLKDIEKYILEEITSTFETEAAAIMLFDEEGKLKIEESRGLPKKAVRTHNEKAITRRDLVEILGKGTMERLINEETVLLDVAKAPTLRKVIPLKNIHYFYLFPLTIERTLEGMVIVFSSSEAPFTQEKVRSVAGMTTHIAVAIHRSRLYDRLYQSYAETTRALAKAIDAKDPYSRGHSENVARIAVQIAEKLCLDPDEIRGIEIAAYLHDIGKIGISEEILRKPVQLSEEEKKILETHPKLSEEILSPIRFPWPVLPMVAHHHERYKGKGYPDRMKGKKIPLGARILAVADAFEAMTSDRPYRAAMSKEEAAKELQKEAGKQFDPAIVKALLDVLGIKKAKRRTRRKKSGAKD